MLKEDIDAYEKFLFTLDWILSVTRRYSNSIQFGLIHISYGSSRILGEQYGAQDASERLVQVCDALRAAFRKTDLVARMGIDFWVLVPYTSSDEILPLKIKGVLESDVLKGLDIVDRDISICALPIASTSELKEGYGAEDLLNYLKENRH